VNDSEYRDLQARIDADIERVSRDCKRQREKRREKSAAKPRKVSWKKFVESECCGVVRKDDHGT
jgi:hypothetical protein